MERKDSSEITVPRSRRKMEHKVREVKVAKFQCEAVWPITWGGTIRFDRLL